MIIKSSQVGINVTVKNRERTFSSLPIGSCSKFKWYFASKSTLMKALALSEGYPGKQLRRVFFLKIIYQLAELRKRIFFSTICVRRIKTALFSKSGRKNFSFYVEGKTVWNAPLLICYRYGIIPHHSGPVRSKANAIYNLVPRETPLQFGYWFYLEKVFFFFVILLLLIKSFFT